MKLCITEKPSVARDIAQILGASVKRDGYFEGAGYKVTWTFGHLCQLKDPADYTPFWKRWALSALPMIPSPFGIKLIDNDIYKRQFQIIQSLVAEAEMVINCGDAGQEGELIQRWVLQKARVKCPVMRLWISSLTDDSIREGFRNLKPQADFDNLYKAGQARAVGDWLLGLNATRLYSLKCGTQGNVLSIGRVQTPTLALVVNRQIEIDNFKPEDFWELSTIYRDTLFASTAGRFKKPQEAEELLKALEGTTFTITDIQQKKGKESPPRLFDLTSLQVECNKRWGWSADESLKLIQTLYEKKVTTYPRVDTTYLSEDIYPKIPSILSQMAPYADKTAPLLQKKIAKTKRIFDNAKVTDHHAIIPTGQSPTTLSGDERKLYHLIACRFIAAFYPDCEFLTTTVLGKAAETEFKASGKVITIPGWRDILSPDTDKTDTDSSGLLPQFSVGESGPHKPQLTKKVTSPPKYYTEGTLLRAMEGAGKTVDDETLREALKENGIGRPSTRASIIETLFKRGYMRRERKSIRATEAGIALIATIQEGLLKSAKLTGLWENKLRRIERGEYDPREFIGELKSMVNNIVINVMSDNSLGKIDTLATPTATAENAPAQKKGTKPRAPRKPAVKSFDSITCPKCGQGHILKGHTAFGCSRFREGCDLMLPFSSYPSTLTPAKLNTIIKKMTKEYGT